MRKQVIILLELFASEQYFHNSLKKMHWYNVSDKWNK